MSQHPSPPPPRARSAFPLEGRFWGWPPGSGGERGRAGCQCRPLGPEGRHPRPPKAQRAAETGASVREEGTLPTASAPVGWRPSAPGVGPCREKEEVHGGPRVTLSRPVLLAPDPTHWHSASRATQPPLGSLLPATPQSHRTPSPIGPQPGPGVQRGGGGSPRGPCSAGHRPLRPRL